MPAMTETKTAEYLLFGHYLRTGVRLAGAAAQAFLETKARHDEQDRQLKSAESLLFSHYLRTGERLYGEAASQFFERKFNQRHYRENGQFARVGEGAVYGGGQEGEAGGGTRNSEGNAGQARQAQSNPVARTKPVKSPPKPKTAPRLPTRKEIIASGAGRVKIQIRDNPRANASAPLHENHVFEQVAENDKNIRNSASRHGVDPDLIRAIIYVESTHGYYDA